MHPVDVRHRHVELLRALQEGCSGRQSVQPAGDLVLGADDVLVRITLPAPPDTFNRQNHFRDAEHGGDCTGSEVGTDVGLTL